MIKKVFQTKLSSTKICSKIINNVRKLFYFVFSVWKNTEIGSDIVFTV